MSASLGSVGINTHTKLKKETEESTLVIKNVENHRKIC